MQKHRIIQALACLAAIGLLAAFVWISRHGDPVGGGTGRDSKKVSANSHGAEIDQFVGSAVCAECHAKISELYRTTGMGRSLADAAQASPMEGDAANVEFSPDGHHHYSIERTPNGTFHHERLTDANDQTVYDQAVKIDYVIGSGMQGRSYVTDRDGQLFMSPIGWYSRDRRWDLSPGYTLPKHQRFERAITEGCLDCHSSQLKTGSVENHFQQPPFVEPAIGCERCHGPGAGHVQYHRSGRKGVNDPIVNPSALDPARREDICAQCHLQGEGRYPREGHRFGDFRPGQRLEDVYLIFVHGTRTNPDGSTQAVSQVEQMHSSACFINSDGRFGCTSCHDAHSQPPRESIDAYYREKCLACHADQGCRLPQPDRLLRQANDSCVACHMPRLDASDVPHTSQTDHRVLRAPTQATITSRLTDELPELFDGADLRLPPVIVEKARGIWLADRAETKADRDMATRAFQVLSRASHERPNDAQILNALGTASAVMGRTEDALTFWNQSLAIDPHRELTLRSMAIVQQSLGRHKAARETLEKYLKLQPWNPSMWGRYSQALGQLGENGLAITAGRKAVELDPSNFRFYQWLAEICGRTGDDEQRRRYTDLFERTRQKDGEAR